MKKKNPLISIIMNCHNGEKFLPEAIESIKNQTYKNWEIIFWDNASTDKSLKIFKKFKGKKFKYFSNKKYVKLYKARNFAIRQASGDFISFLDTDDYWKKNFLKEFINKIYKEKSFFVCSKFLVKNLKKNKTNINTLRDLPNIINTQDLLNKYNLGILSVMIKKKLLTKFKFNDKYQIIGDFDLFVRLSKIIKIHSINRPLATYRYHGNNLSKKRFDIYIKEINEWIGTFEDKNDYNFKKLKFFILKQKLKLLLSKFFG